MKNFLLLCMLLTIMFSCEEGAVSQNQSSSSGNSGTTGTGGSTARFTIANDHLYIATEEALSTYSIEDPLKPDFKSQQAFFNVETIFSLDNYLYLGTQVGVLIFDISTPNNPLHLSTYSHITSCDPVVVQGNYAYSTLRSGGQGCWRGVNSLDIIDITNKEDPRLVSQNPMVGPIGLGISGDHLYVCDDDHIKHFDVSNPTLPSYIRETELMGCFDVIINGERLIAVSNQGVSQYKIEPSGFLTPLSTIKKE